jgi:hypothetical protein
MTIKQEANRTRKEFITDCVKTYIKNNPAEYMKFVEKVKERRKLMADQEFGVVRDDLKSWQKYGADSIRIGLSLPEKLYNTLDTLLMGEDERFCEAKGEIRWFAKKFPEFFIPEKY